MIIGKNISLSSTDWRAWAMALSMAGKISPPPQSHCEEIAGCVVTKSN
jgi:hypothetical protein